MLTKRERALLADIESRLREQDPGYVRRISRAEPPRPVRGSRVLELVLGLLALAAAIAVLLGATGFAAVLALAAGTVALTLFLEELG